jgi:hypothetical protein
MLQNQPFIVEALAERILIAIRHANLNSARYRTSISKTRDLRRASILRCEAGEHTCVCLDECEEGIKVEAGNFSGLLRSEAELEAMLPALLDGVRFERTQLTPRKLKPGKRYRVIAAVACDVILEPGTVLCFCETIHARDGGFSIYQFRREGHGGDRVDLVEMVPDHWKLLNTMHVWLEPLEPLP